MCKSKYAIKYTGNTKLFSLSIASHYRKLLNLNKKLKELSTCNQLPKSFE